MFLDALSLELAYWAMSATTAPYAPPLMVGIMATAPSVPPLVARLVAMAPSAPPLVPGVVVMAR